MRHTIKVVTSKHVTESHATFLQMNGFDVRSRKSKTFIMGLPEDFADLSRNESIFMSDIINDVSLKITDGDFTWSN